MDAAHSLSLDAIGTAPFWIAVLQIIMIDLLLSGDNAVVIALACRNLPAEQRRKGIIFGVGGAIGLRIILTFFAVGLLALPYLKLIGAALLIWIGIKLIIPEDDHDESNIKADTKLFGAIKTIIIADFVMSLDNVIGVAAAAKGSVALLVFGLLISIPLIAFSSQLALKLIDRFPIIIYAGGALLGYVAGEMLVTEASLAAFVNANHYTHWLFPATGALMVLMIGVFLSSRHNAKQKAVDLVDGSVSSNSNKD